MSEWQIVLMIGIPLVIAAAVTAVILVGRSPNGCKRRVTNRLRQYASIRSYKVLSDVTLNYGKEKVHADNLLIGFFGLLFINVQVENADFYGEERDEYWALVKKDSKTRFENPLNASVKMMDAVRKVFAANNVYNIGMEQLVVFTASFRKATLNIKDTLPIVNVRKLGALLGKTRYEKDNGVDVELLARLIEENRVKDV